jgi:hypothetical protein
MFTYSTGKRIGRREKFLDVGFWFFSILCPALTNASRQDFFGFAVGSAIRPCRGVKPAFVLSTRLSWKLSRLVGNSNEEPLPDGEYDSFR